jgi:hypothetical protein
MFFTSTSCEPSNTKWPYNAQFALKDMKLARRTPLHTPSTCKNIIYISKRGKAGVRCEYMGIFEHLWEYIVKKKTETNWPYETKYAHKHTKLARRTNLFAPSTRTNNIHETNRGVVDVRGDNMSFFGHFWEHIFENKHTQSDLMESKLALNTRNLPTILPSTPLVHTHT